MPQIIVDQPFKFAHRGCDVEEFEPSADPRETTDECARVACEEGWARLAGDRQAATLEAAPENRDAALKPRSRKEP
jgi:hypothetical protein